MLQSAQTARNRTPNNHGERLYQNGLKRLEEKKRKFQKDKMEKELQECENLTFRPQINPISKCMGRLNDRALEDNLIDRGKKSKDMIEKKRSEILFENQYRHSFKPKINKNSEKMIMERSRQFLEESAAQYGTPDESSHKMDSSYISAQNKLDKFLLLYDDAVK